MAAVRFSIPAHAHTPTCSEGRVADIVDLSPSTLHCSDGSGEHSGASLYQRSLGRSQPHGVCKPCAENHHLKTKNTRMALHGGQVNWRMGSHGGNGIHGMALKSAHPAEFRQIEAGNGTDPFLCVWGGWEGYKICSFCATLRVG